MAKLSSLVRKRKIVRSKTMREKSQWVKIVCMHVKVVGLVADVFCTTKMRSTPTDVSSLSVQLGALLNLLALLIANHRK